VLDETNLMGNRHGREFSMMRTERRQQVWMIENFLPPIETGVQ
jgi:hypothetical protein